MNNLNTYIEIAWKSLKQQKSRTILTIMALSIGIALLIIMLAAGQGLKSLVLSQLDIYNPNTISIEVKVPGKTNATNATAMASGSTITTFKNSDVDAIAKVKNVESLFAYVTGQEIFKYKNANKTVIIYGYGATAPDIQKIDFSNGRFYTSDEEDSLSQVVVLGSKLKQDLFGDQDAIGENVYVKSFPFRVVGVVKSQGGSSFVDMDSIAYIPTKTMQKKILGTDYVLGALIQVKDPDKINETKDDLQFLMEDRHNITDPDKDDFQLTTMAEARDMIDTILNSITLLLVALTFISLLVGGVGITNIMYVSVIERTFEIGLRRSVGAKKEDILWQFLAEAIIQTLFGGIVGIIFGSGVAFAIYYVAVSFGLSWTYSVSFLSILLALIFSAVLGLAFGVYPARQAANLDPITALKKD
ncbi:MAG: ABC transporter permease [Candidatus Paceibacterota bacterium]|jgi:ABC-type antimicrobial peptide transport system permease subunit